MLDRAPRPRTFTGNVWVSVDCRIFPEGRSWIPFWSALVGALHSCHQSRAVAIPLVNCDLTLATRRSRLALRHACSGFGSGIHCPNDKDKRLATADETTPRGEIASPLHPLVRKHGTDSKHHERLSGR